VASDKVDFYVRHRRQIDEWARLEKRADSLMRQAVDDGSPDDATKLLRGESGDDEVDFYVRNRVLITEWDALQTLAGEALHTALVDSARAAGFGAYEGKRGWTTVRSPEFDTLRDKHRVSVELAWTRQDLLSTRRGYPFPRLAMELHPETWTGERREILVRATRAIAGELGMTKKDKWWVRWRMLEEISSSLDLSSYADACVEALRSASARLYPVLLEVTASTSPGPA
jgi:hypothetical protein